MMMYDKEMIALKHCKKMNVNISVTNVMKQINVTSAMKQIL